MEKNDEVINNRISYFDIAKTIALFFIVLSHTHTGIPLLSSLFTSSYIAVFFVISGYLINLDTLDIWKRIKRLLFPYLKYSLLLLIVMTLFNFINNDFSINDVLLSVFGIIYSRNKLFLNSSIKILNICNAPLWFLTAMISSTIIVWLVRKLYKMSNLVVIMCLIFISWLLCYCPFLLPWSIDVAFLLATFIFVGNKIKCNGSLNKYVKIDFFKRLLIFIFLSIIYIILIILVGEINLSIRVMGSNTLLSIILVFLIGVIGSLILIILSYYLSKVKYINSLCIIISKNSILIMSVHYFIFYMIEKVFSHLPNTYITIIQLCILTVLFSFYIFFKKIGEKIVNKSI